MNRFQKGKRQKARGQPPLYPPSRGGKAKEKLRIKNFEHLYGRIAISPYFPHPPISLRVEYIQPLPPAT